jgi:hypothetical protein
MFMTMNALTIYLTGRYMKKVRFYKLVFSLNPRLKLHIKINVHLEILPLKHKWNDFDHAKIKKQYEYEAQHTETRF